MSPEQIEKYRDRLADERAKKRMELGYAPEFSSWKDGFDAALELGKALGGAKMIEEVCADLATFGNKQNYTYAGLYEDYSWLLERARERIAKMVENR